MTKLLSSNKIWWIFAGLTIFVYFYGLGVPLLGPDEPRYAQVAREMFERGDWITPTLGGFEWFEKPALLYWLQIAAYSVFGVNEFAARFGSTLCGLGTIASLWLLGRLTLPAVDREAANWIALIAATTLGLAVFAHGASFDIIATFPLTASLTGFFIFDRLENAKNKVGTAGLFAFYFFAGVAVLAKGLIGIVFPFATVGLYFLFSKRFPSARFTWSLVWGSVVIVLVAAVWNLPMYIANGWEFIDEFYIQHHFQRYTSNKYQHPQPFYFYIWVLPLLTIPWIPFFAAALWKSVRQLFLVRYDSSQLRKIEEFSSNCHYEEEETTDVRADTTNIFPHSFTPLLIFAACWIAVPLIFFSLSGSKLPGYILPAVPGTILLTAAFVIGFIQQARIRRVLVFGIAFSTFFLFIGLLTFSLPKYADNDSVMRLIESADSLGYSSLKVASVGTISHNMEYYAAGRLLRNADGKQRKFENAKEVASEIKNDEPVLALVPNNRIEVVENLDEVDVRPLAKNAEFTIFAIAPFKRSPLDSASQSVH